MTPLLDFKKTIDEANEALKVKEPSTINGPPGTDFTMFYKYKIPAVKALKDWFIETLKALITALPKNIDSMFPGKDD
jgi:hypothetical protein